MGQLHRTHVIRGGDQPVQRVKNSPIVEKSYLGIICEMQIALMLKDCDFRHNGLDIC